MNRICVLGGSGMLGSALVRVLKIKSGIDPKAPSWPEIIRHSSSDCDLTDIRDTVRYLRDTKPTHVFNCAGLVGGILVNMRNQYDHLYVNSAIAINSARACRQTGVENYFYISSSCMYPSKCEQPMQEHMLLSGSPESTNQGYALAKILGGEITKYIRDQYNLNYRTFIPCNLYGQNDNFSEDGHVLAALVSKICNAKAKGLNEVVIWGDGTARREFMHIDDCARAIVLASEKTNRSFVNIGSGYDVSIKELAQIIANAAEWDGNFVYDTRKPNGMMRKLLDSGWIQKAGYEESIPLPKGIRMMIKEYNDAIAAKQQ